MLVVHKRIVEIGQIVALDEVIIILLVLFTEGDQSIHWNLCKVHSTFDGIAIAE